MRTFKEFLLEDTLEEQTVYLPAGAEVVSVSKASKGIQLLVIATPNGYETNLPEIRTFKICLTDENFPWHTVKSKLLIVQESLVILLKQLFNNG